MCRVLGRYKTFVDTRDMSIGVHPIADGYWEMCHAEAMPDPLKPGMKAVDIGANLGYFSLSAIDHGRGIARADRATVLAKPMEEQLVLLGR